jgi:hypothetical protein
LSKERSTGVNGMLNSSVFLIEPMLMVSLMCCLSGSILMYFIASQVNTPKARVNGTRKANTVQILILDEYPWYKREYSANEYDVPSTSHEYPENFEDLN